MSESVWILGIHMTKFGKHPDLDAVDLASQAARGALSDAGVGIKDIGVLAAGNLMKAAEGIGQQLQKQIGQTGIPVFNVANACATGATAVRVVHMALRSGEADYGLAVGVEKLSGAGLLGAPKSKDDKRWTADGRFGAVSLLEGRTGTDLMPGVFAQIGMEYAHRYGGADLELFARIAEKNHAHSTLNPLAAYQKRFTLEQIINGVMIAYPKHQIDVLGELRRSLGSRPRHRDQAANALVGAAAARRQDQCFGTDQRPVAGGVPGVARHQHPHAPRRHHRLRAGGIGPEELNLVELHDCFATAELVHYDNLGLCEPGGAIDFVRSGRGWRDGTHRQRQRRPGVQGPPDRGHWHRRPLRSLDHLRGEAGPRHVEGPRVGSAHVSGSAAPAGSTSSRRARSADRRSRRSTQS